MIRIAFVCTGNTGRSMIAEVLARAMIAADMLPLEVISRAAALNPRHLEPNAAALLARRGLDVSSHRAKRLTAEDIRQSDLVWVMTAAHRTAVIGMFPDAAGKIFLLSEYAAGEAVDITDAYGQPVPVYQETLRHIEQYVREALVKVLGTKI